MQNKNIYNRHAGMYFPMMVIMDPVNPTNNLYQSSYNIEEFRRVLAREDKALVSKCHELENLPAFSIANQSILNCVF